MICKNEEARIERALQSLTWADEIIIVDGHSTDKTVEIAKKYTGKVFIRDWTDFGDQRNFALDQTQYPWVFFLDADEVCSPDLVGWFQLFKQKGPEGMSETVSGTPSVHPLGKPNSERIDLYEIRRWEHFRGKLHRFGANNPSH